MFQINQYFKASERARGQTIIEAVIALASIMLTLAAIAVAITTSVNNSQFVKNQSLAGRYAQDGMEYVRNLHKTDPTAFAAKDGIKCMHTDNVFDDTPCAVPNIDGAFIRNVEFAPGANDCGQRPTTAPSSSPMSGTQVIVTVAWSSGKCGENDRFCHESHLVSCFSTPTVSSGL